MAHIYPDKVHEWRIIYRLHFPNGTYRHKTRFRKKKVIAEIVFSEVSSLETQSRRGSLTKAEITFARNQHYISSDESTQLSGGEVPLNFNWNDLVKKYEKHSTEKCTPATHKINLNRLNVATKHFKNINPAEITKQTVMDYLDKRRSDGRKSATLLKDLHLLCIMLDPLGDPNPARSIKLPKIRDERIPRPLYPAEILAFLLALKNHIPDKKTPHGPRAYLRGYMRAITLTALYSGLRPSELVNLYPEDIDLRAGKILVQGKTGRRTKTGYARSVDIHPKINVYLRSSIAKGGKFLFGGGKKIDAHSLHNVLNDVIKKTDIRGVTPYSLRHTFITGLLDAGANLRYVMEVAGHRDIYTTKRYLHVTPAKDSPVRKISYKARG